ncbi:MAG: hypothetical protein LBB21_05930 [Holosporaceae bacterium]|jgi:hypothetical protein|nr:hypothetical protein [Holosporaceae bacterium]
MIFNKSKAEFLACVKSGRLMSMEISNYSDVSSNREKLYEFINFGCDSLLSILRIYCNKICDINVKNQLFLTISLLGTLFRSGYSPPQVLGFFNQIGDKLHRFINCEKNMHALENMI